MLVDVIRMRAEGQRLPVSELKAAMPVRGKLGVFVRTDLHRNQSVVCAMLEGKMVSDFRIPVLDHMRLTRMRGDSFVLVGFEEIQHRKISDVYPQAWWCRVVCEATGRVAEVDDKEVEQVASVF